MALQELITKYSFQVDTRPLEKVQEKTEKLVAFSAKLGLAMSAAAGTIFAFAKSNADAGDEALAASQKIGVSVENLTRLQFAAKQSNVDAQGLGAGLRFLARNAFAAAEGSKETAEAFAKIGVRVKDSAGVLKPANELLLEVAQKFKAMPDGVNKTALSMKIFGKAGADLIPLLNEGSDGIQKMMDRADELGITMSTDFAKAGDLFNDTLDEATGALKGVGKAVAAQMLPALTQLLKKFTDFIVANKKIVAGNLDIFFKSLATFVRLSWVIFQAMQRTLSGVVALFGGLENAVKVVTYALVIFAGAKILAGIGALFIAITQLGNGFLLMQAKALALPILIGAAIAAVGLILEDIFTFFTDPEAETFTKNIVDGIKSLWKVLDEFFQSMNGWGQTLVTVLLTPFRLLIATIRSFFDILKGDWSSASGLMDIAKNLGGNAKQAFMGGDTLGETFGFRPSGKDATTQRLESQFMNNAPSIVNNINVGQNADISQIGANVFQSTKEGMDASVRSAERSFNKKGGY